MANGCGCGPRWRAARRLGLRPRPAVDAVDQLTAIIKNRLKAIQDRPCPHRPLPRSDRAHRPTTTAAGLITGPGRLPRMSFIVRHAGQGTAYDFDGARFVMKASGAETGGQLAEMEVLSPAWPLGSPTRA